MPIIDKYERRFQDIANRLLTGEEDATLRVIEWEQNRIIGTHAHQLRVEVEFQLPDERRMWRGTYRYYRPNEQAPWQLLNTDVQELP